VSVRNLTKVRSRSASRFCYTLGLVPAISIEEFFSIHAGDDSILITKDNSILLAPKKIACCYSSGMDYKQNRRDNLLIVRDRQGGTWAALAEKTETAAAYLSQIANNRRDMGDSLARRIETVADLPSGWMDQCHDKSKADLQVIDGGAKKPLVDRSVLMQCIVMVDNIEAQHGLDLTAHQRASLIASGYESCIRNGMDDTQLDIVMVAAASAILGTSIQ